MGLYALTHVNIVSTGSTGTDSDMLGFAETGFEPMNIATLISN